MDCSLENLGGQKALIKAPNISPKPPKSIFFIITAENSFMKLKVAWLFQLLSHRSFAESPFTSSRGWTGPGSWVCLHIVSSSSFSSFFRAGSAGWMAKRHDSSAHPKLERVLNKTSKNQTSMADLEAAPVADVPIQDAALCSFYRKIRPLPCKEKFKIQHILLPLL